MTLSSASILCALLPPLATATSFQELEPLVGGAARIAAWEEHRSLTAAMPSSMPSWRPIGPKNCGGRIEAVDSPAGKPSVIYAGVGSGGVWKSTNGGLAWEHVFARESTFAVGDVTVDPSRGETVWVGTGEAHLGGKSYDGTGVFRSGDGGATWTNMGLVDSARIAKVLVDPRDSGAVCVAVMGPRSGAHQGRGVHLSLDGGVSWKHTLFAGEQVGIIDLVRDPFDPDRLWAAAWDRSRAGEGGVFRSTDGGRTWVRLGGGLLEGKDLGRVAVAASASEEGVVYALMVDHSPPGEGRYDVGGALYRSNDGGASWARTSKDYVDTYVGWDFCDVMVAPDNADQVYVCGFRLMVSSNGGASFERGGEKVFRLLEHPGRGMHLDMHDLWIDPSNPDRILLGTDGGLYVSMDRAKSWLHLNNLPIAEFYTVHLAEGDPFSIWGGTQDNASLMAPGNASLDGFTSDDWSYVYLDPWDGGDGFATFPDPSGDGTVYYEHQNGDMRRKLPGAPLRWGKGSGKRITPKAKGAADQLRFAWNTPLFPSQHAANTLYCAAQYVFRSGDRGDSWRAISADLTRGSGAVTALSESPLNKDRLAAGAGRGRLSLTDDGGATWSHAGEGLPRKELLRVELSRHSEDRLFVCLSGTASGDCRPYIYGSIDFGKSWSWIGKGLPAAAVNVVIEGPREDGELYAGTDLGVYRSSDGGRTWTSLSKGLPTAPVLDLELHPGTSTLVAVTHGLSAFALALPTD